MVVAWKSELRPTMAESNPQTQRAVHRYVYHAAVGSGQSGGRVVAGTYMGVCIV